MKARERKASGGISPAASLERVQPGLPYANQLPSFDGAVPANGTASRQGPPSPALQKIAGLLAGQAHELPPFAPQPITFCDDELDGTQREAVRRALFTPDLFLLQGLPGTGRSRVVAEILKQVAIRGEKALFLANHPASIDVVLPLVDRNQAVLALRFLEAAERAAFLPPEVLRFTMAERQQALKVQARQAAVERQAQAEQQLVRRQSEEGCWSRLRETAEKMDEAQRRLEDCRQRVDVVVADVDREAATENADGALGAALARMKGDHLECVAALEREITEHESKRALAAAEFADVNEALGALRPLAEAKRRGRWWTWAWWRATFRGRVPVAMAELEARHQALDGQVQAVLNVCDKAHEKCRRLEEQYEVERTDLIRAEIDRRRQQVLQQRDTCTDDLEQLTAAWQQICLSMETPAHRPTEPTPAALAAAEAHWRDQRQRDQEACEFAKRWAEYLASAGDEVASRIPDWANVLAGTATALSQDGAFAKAAAGAIDVVVFEDADQLTDTDLLQAARHASRWILVAETHEPPWPNAAGPPQDGRGPLAARPLARGGCFQKLWQRLHCDSLRLHYAWRREEARLCCMLRPVSGNLRAHLEIERLADYPEIELRILAVPKAPPVVAQVVFPASMSLSEAKVFIYRELEEAAIQGTDGGVWVADEGDGLVLNVAPTSAGDLVALELEPGLREWVSLSSLTTARLEFASGAGWTRAKVEEWLERYLDLGDSGRTLALRVAYRMMPALAASVNDIVFSGAYVLPPGEPHLGRLEFVAVPPVSKSSKTPEKRKPLPGANGFAGLPREGAGLELDLAAARGNDRMPADIRAHLPRRGFANYLEAQALLRKLEELVAQGAGAREPVVVIALYEGQVALLRRLAEGSETLRQKPGAYDIGLPAAFRQREWTTVLVSLTRSHGYRAVSFSEREGDLATALTRARGRLIVFGDPGTLVKRSHWHGPLDHLDANAADLEAGRITALLRWLTPSL